MIAASHILAFLTGDWGLAVAKCPGHCVRERGLGFRPTMRDLRHAHASWLLAGGADIQVVKERLGHATIATGIDRDIPRRLTAGRASHDLRN